MDGAKNGFIVDPSGAGVAPAGGGGAPGGGGGGGGGGCFIASAKEASPVPGKILALILLLGSGITVLIGFKRS